MFLYSIVFPSLPLCSLFFSSFIPVLRACRLCFCSWWGFFFHLQRFMLHIVVSTPLPYRFPTVVGALCVCVCMYACRSFVFIRSVAPRFASSAAPITWWKVTQHGQMEALQRSAPCKVATIPYIRKKDKKEIPFLTTIAHKHSHTETASSTAHRVASRVRVDYFIRFVGVFPPTGQHSLALLHQRLTAPIPVGVRFVAAMFTIFNQKTSSTELRVSPLVVLRMHSHKPPQGMFPLTDYNLSWVETDFFFVIQFQLRLHVTVVKICFSVFFPFFCLVRD